MRKKESLPEKSKSSRTIAMILLGLGALVAVFIILLGVSAPAHSAPPVPSYMAYVPGNDHGAILLVGRSSCPHCQATKNLLATLNIGYYWVDLDSLDQANTTQVMRAIGFCGQVEYVPVLVINNRPPCIIGFNETRIREALA
jgi:glutaredoxin